MKKSKFIIAILSLLIAANSLIAGDKALRVKPVNSKKGVTVEAEGKKHKYYYLSDKKSILVSVDGPGVLRLISRALLPNNNASADYSIVYSVDGGKAKEVTYKKIKPAPKAKFTDKANFVPGALKDLNIKVGRGYHTIKISLKSSLPEVAAVFLFKPTKEKSQKWISYDPLSPAEPVELVVKEEIVQYYRFTRQKPLKVSIIGPTELRVFTRTENDNSMRGRINYRVQAKDGANKKTTYLISSARSETAVYKNNGSLTPGKAQEFVIKVPKGRHSYEIIPLDKDKNSLLGRLMFPEKDARLSE